MERPEGTDVLVAGPEVTHPGRTRVVTFLAVAGLAAVVGAMGMTAWLDREPTSSALEVVDIAVTGDRAVTIEAVPPLGALATPAGTTLPGIALSVRVGGDPGVVVEVTGNARDATAYVAPTEVTTVSAGGFADIALTIAPVNCARDGIAGTASVSPLTTSDGSPVPLAPAARDSLAAALAGACAPSGNAPVLTVTSASYGKPPALDSIRLTVDVAAAADRLVLTPLDGPGLRGLGSADRNTGSGIPLLWLLTTGSEAGGLLASAQVYVVRGSTAYPWIVSIPLVDDVSELISTDHAADS